MRAAQGRTLEDGSYIYVCGLCRGRGNNAECPWCYGLNFDRIVEEMRKGARGQRYYSLLKAHLSITGKAMVDECKRLRTELGAITPVEIAYLSVKFKLNFKATWEWLEETRCLRTSYDSVVLGFKVKEIVAAAREKYPELNEIEIGD
jgi:hypothetical protein